MAAPAINTKNYATQVRNAPPVIWYFAVAAAVLALLAPTTATLVETWVSSANYIHGLLAFGLSFILIWTRRSTLTFGEAPISPLAGGILFACLTCWLIAYHNDINFLAEATLVFTLIAAFWGLFGLTALRSFAAPLGVLIFAVPLGDGLLPPLQQVTAWGSGLLLEVSGIQYVYDHPYFTTAAARFHISEACAGMNYVSMSALAAYLLSMRYRLLLPRAMLLLTGAALLAVVMNGVRAFSVIAGVTLLPESALAADHLWLGLVLFAPLLILLAFVATRLASAQESTRTATRTDPAQINDVEAPNRNLMVMLVLLALFSFCALLLNAI